MEINIVCAIDDWMRNYKKNSVKEASYSRYRVSFDMMKRYPIAKLNVSDLNCNDIQRFMNQLVEDGYALTTIKKQYTLLTGFLKYAVSQGYIATPIYLGVKMPSKSAVRKPRKEIETYNPIEQKRLMRVLETLSHRSYAAAILMLEEGLRVGEALALTWNDIIWERKALRISKTLVRLSGERQELFVQQSPKSESSNRIVPISKKAMEILNRICDGNDGYIFARDDDASLPIGFESLRWHLRKACAEANVPYKGNHIFRHTFATNCYNRGCDVKILSKLLGHAEVGITYNIYIHLYGDSLEELRAVVD